MKPWMVIVAAAAIFAGWLALWGQEWGGMTGGDAAASEAPPVKGSPLFRPAPDPAEESPAVDSEATVATSDGGDGNGGEGNVEGASFATEENAATADKPLDGNPEHGHMSADEIADTTGVSYTENEDGSINVDFKMLSSFQYYAPDPNLPEEKQRKNRIPAEIVALSGKLVNMGGYMFPFNSKGGTVTSFYLARDPLACCFGRMPAINELIEVHMVDDEEVPIHTGIPVLVIGVLTVEERMDDFGYVNSIYTIDAEKVQELW